MTDTQTTYSYEELSFARRVREIAVAYRDQRAPKNVDNDSRIERERWLAHNPVESFYEEVINTTTGVADQIRAILSRPKA